MIWARMLAYITGTVDQELLLRNEYLVAENRILRAQIQGRLHFSDSEKAALAEIAHRLGRKALADVASAAKPDTLLGWYRKLIAKKFEGSRLRKSRGRPRTEEEIERLVVRMAKKETPVAVMTGSPGRCLTLVTRFLTRPWGISYGVMIFPQPQNGSRARVGKTSSVPIWR